METLRAVVTTLFLTAFAGATPAFAQDASDPGRLRVEAQTGMITFVEDDIDHLFAGGAGRFALTRRLAVGPDVTYLQGPGADRHVVMLGILNVDLGPVSSRRRVQPYFLAGGGFGTDRMPTGRLRYGWLIDVGGGARIAAGDRWYIAPEFRLGWGAHWRFGVAAGWQ